MSGIERGISDGDNELTSSMSDIEPGTSESAARFYETQPGMRATVEVAGRTHPGIVRPSNEDHYLVVRRYRGREVLATSLPVEMMQKADDHAYTFAVADGMGGRAFGEVASLFALMTGWELGGDEVKWTLRLNDREEKEFRRKVRTVFRLLNQGLHEQIRNNPKLTGMGTTLTIGYSTGDELFVAHAGDSRAYLLRAGTLERLTRDHNLAQLLVDSGAAAEDSPEVRKSRHVLTNVLGGPDLSIEVDIHRTQLLDGDTLLFCTDGLNDRIEDDEIGRMLDAAPTCQDACQTLLDLALERGGRDNITVVVARYQFERLEPHKPGEPTPCKE